jgi:protein-S-isoprenylcysteine O-methyltransferase Ste14
MHLQSGFLQVGLAVILFGALHSTLAAHRTKAFIERWSPQRIHRWYRLSFNVIAVSTLLPLLALVVLLPDFSLYRIPHPWLFLTIPLQLLAVAGLLLGLGQTGASDFLGLSQLTRGDETSPPLISTGFYRWVRHPLYAFSLLIIWLTPSMSCNILAFNLAATLYITFGTLLEERKLASEFGQAYIAYCRRTPMLFPLKFNRRGSPRS